MRTTVFAALLVGAFFLGLSFVPMVRAQGTPALGAISNFVVNPVDRDGNGKFDALVGSFLANVTEAGNFRFQAMLWGSYGSYYIGTNNTDLNLGIGSYNLSVSIPGPAIYLSRAFGPYDFRLNVFTVGNNGLFNYTYFYPTDIYTNAYNATDFEAPPVYFGSPITSAAVSVESRPFLIESAPSDGPTVRSSSTLTGAGSAPARRTMARSVAS